MNNVKIETTPVFDRPQSGLAGYNAVQRMWNDRFGMTNGHPAKAVTIVFKPKDGSASSDREAWELASSLYERVMGAVYLTGKMEVTHDGYRVTVWSVRGIAEKTKSQLRMILGGIK